MLKSKLLIFTLISTFYVSTARPQNEDFVIDLSKYGTRIFGTPIKNFGILSNSSENPEETGPYLEGDLLIPTKGRNGMTSQSLRWKNRVVPYVIRGLYSEKI